MKKWNLIIYSPAYNVEKSIGELLKRTDIMTGVLLKSGVKLKQFIIINDGSTDRTGEIIEEFRGNIPVRQIKKTKNEGAVAAVLDGMKESIGFLQKNRLNDKRTIIVRMDSDLEHQPEDIPRLIEKIISEKSGIGVGYIPFDSRSGILMQLFNKYAGLNESRMFLNIDIPQFCPGFNAIKANIFINIWSALRQIVRKYAIQNGEELLAIDLVVLALGKKSAEKISVIKLKTVETKYVNKPKIQKLAHYINQHYKIVKFLKPEL